VFREYCNIDGLCTNFHPTCDLSGYICSDDKMLHLPSGQCFERGNYECLGAATTSKFIPVKYHKYEVVFIKEVRSTYDLHLLYDNFITSLHILNHHRRTVCQVELGFLCCRILQDQSKPLWHNYGLCARLLAHSRFIVLINF
jgi:hypothetical protein